MGKKKLFHFIIINYYSGRNFIINMIHKTILKINLFIRYVSSIEGGFWCHAGCVWSISRVGIRKILYTHDFESGAEGGRGGG